MANKLVHLLLLSILLAVPLAGGPLHAQNSGKIRVSGFSDINFGGFPQGGDAVSSQSICVFSANSLPLYSVTAIGAGNGGQFALTTPGYELPIEIMWSELAGQQTGDQLQASVASRSFTTLAVHQKCNRGPAATASLIVRVRETEIAKAASGVYSGNLTLIVSPS